VFIIRTVLIFLLCATCGLAQPATATTLQYPVQESEYVPGSYGNRVFLAGNDHLGEDIKLPEGVAVRSIGDGRIVVYRPATGYGELVAVVEHDLGKEYAFINGVGELVVTRHLLSIYGHIRDRQRRGDTVRTNWREGQEIKRGDVLGYVNDSSHPDLGSDDHNGDGLEHLHQGIRLQSAQDAQREDPGAWFRGYRKGTNQQKWFASGEAVIQIVKDGGIRQLCAEVSSPITVCWTPASPSKVHCPDATNWLVYFSPSAVLSATDARYCPSGRTVFAHYGGSMARALGGGGATPSFNLKLDFDIMDSSLNVEWQAGQHLLRSGQVVKLRAVSESEGGDVRQFMRQGRDRVEVDFHVRIDAGEWTRVSREYIKVDNLRDSKKAESVQFTIPLGVKSIAFKVKIDAEDEVFEFNEGDNWSRVETFDVTESPPTVNLVPTALEVPGTVTAGGEYRVRFAFQNVGNSLPRVGARGVYQLRGPGTNNVWLNQTDDGSDPEDLVPGRVQWEETKSPLRAPTIAGRYEQRVCLDYQQSVIETSEDDNCISRSFLVVAPLLPDLIVTFIEIDPWRDDSIQKGREHHPTMKIKNVGSGPVTTNIRSAYYWYGPSTGNVWQQIADDGTDAAELCVGCEVTETIKAGFKATKKGVHYLKACVNYQGQQPEGNTVNNCLQSGPIKVK